MGNKLRIFSDRSLVTAGKGHVVMLYPFWGNEPEDSLDPASGRFDRYKNEGRDMFIMTGPDEADLWIFPMPWEEVLGDREEVDKARRFIDNARSLSKKVVIFFWSDSTEDLPFDDAIIFRTSLYRSRRKANEFAMPAWSEDFVAKYLNSSLPLRRKKERPVVGFCGYAYPWYPMDRILSYIKRRIKRWMRPAESDASWKCFPDPVQARLRALRALSRSREVDTNFIIRSRFWDGTVLPSGLVDKERQRVARGEFLKNMIHSDYILCARGVGNFSYRLYETLSCGRIPVFIDTDCFLPYHLEIDWSRYCVWVEEEEIDRIGQKVAKFHESLKAEEFTELQKACRRLWEEWLSPEGFFSNFHRHFQGSSEISLHPISPERGRG